MKATTKAADQAANGNGRTSIADERGPTPETTAKPSATRRRAEQNLVETAAIAGIFTTLGTAIRAAGLVDTLSGKGPFTMFAPTDAAFAKVPKADLDALLNDKARLRQVLTYHVVSRIVSAPKQGSPKTPTTIHGAALEITAKDRGFRVNDAKVVHNELLASNGVIHAIDEVLLPR